MILDIVVLAVVVASTLFAFFRGFIREVLTIFGVVGGALASVYLGPFLSPLVKGWIGADVAEGEEAKRLFGILPYDMVADILSYGVIFLVFVILLSVISHLLANWAKAIGLGFFDRILGVLFGLVRAVVLLALLYLPVYLLTEPKERAEYQWLASSKSRPYIEKSSAWMARFMPETSEEDVEAIKKEASTIATKTAEKVTGLKEKAKESLSDAEKTAEDAEGYKEEQRDELDQLFEDAADE